MGFLYPKPSPWGEGGPAQPGRMRGRPGTQRSRRKPAYRRQAPLGTGFLQGKASESSPPHQSASQTASPQGEAAGRGRSTALIPFVRNDSPSPPSWGAGRSPASDAGPQAGPQKKAGYPEGYPKPEWGVQRGETLPSGVLSSISHRRNGGRRQAPPRGAAPRGRFGGTARRVRTHGGRAPRPHVAGYNLRWFQRYGLPPPTGGLTPPARRSGGPCWPASARRRRSTPRRRGSPG